MPTIEGPDPDSPFFKEKNKHGLLMAFIRVRVAPTADRIMAITAFGGRTPCQGVSVWALIDTGAGSSVIAPGIAQMLALEPHDMGTAYTLGVPLLN